MAISYYVNAAKRCVRWIYSIELDIQYFDHDLHP